MPESSSIPRLTPEESAMAYKAEHAGRYTMTTFILAYLHWNKARGDMLANTAVQARLLASVSKEGE